MCENFYANCNSNNCNNNIENKNKLQFRFDASIGFSSSTTSEYLLLPYHSSILTFIDGLLTIHVAPLKSSINNGYNAIQLTIPTIFKQKITYVSIHLATTVNLENTTCCLDGCIIPKSITITIYIYIFNNPLSIATATTSDSVLTTSITLGQNETFVQKLQPVNIYVPDMSYIYVSYISSANLDALCPLYWLNVIMG